MPGMARSRARASVGRHGRALLQPPGRLRRPDGRAPSGRRRPRPAATPTTAPPPRSRRRGRPTACGPPPAPGHATRTGAPGRGTRRTPPGRSPSARSPPGTSACRTRPDRGTCHAAYRRWALATCGWWATKPALVVALAEQRRHLARAPTRPPDPRPRPSPRRRRNAARAAASPAPCGVGRPSHQPCPRSGWNVGSPPPRRRIEMTSAHARPAVGTPHAGRARPSGTCGKCRALG